MKNKIVAVFGDIGGCKETLPALQILRERGFTVGTVVSEGGKAVSVLTTSQATSDSFLSNGSIDGRILDGIVVGTSATAGSAQIAWTDWGRSHAIPVIWVEDLYGTGERTAVRGSAGPDVLCVIDEMAADIARRGWPKAKVVVCGKPTFKRVGVLLAQQDTIRAQVREKLNIDARERLLTWFSGGERPEEEIATLIEGIEPLQKYNGLRVAARVHPKMPEPALGEIRARIASWSSRFRIDPIAVFAADANELTLASDIVVGTWGSTQCYVAVLARAACISTHFGSAEQRLAAGYADGLSPAVAAGAAMAVTIPAEIVSRVGDVLRGRGEGAHIEAVRNMPFRPLIAPGAAERIADAIVAAMG